MKKLLLTLSAVLMTFSAALAVTATRVKSASELTAGTKYIIVGYVNPTDKNPSKSFYAMNITLSSGYFGAVDMTKSMSDNNATISFDNEKIAVIQLEASNDASYPWFIKVTNATQASKPYINCSKKDAVYTDSGSKVLIKDGKNEYLTIQSTSSYMLRFNPGNPRFKPYEPKSTSCVDAYFYAIQEDVDPNKVAKPTISCADNKVTITAVEGASVYYTTDGVTEPTEASTKYGAPFDITEDMTVKAIAVKDGKTSDVAIAEVKYTVAQPEITCTENVVTITYVDGASVFYTIDGSNPTTESTPYTEPFKITKNVTVKAIAVKNGVSSAVASQAVKHSGVFSNFAELIAAGKGTTGKVMGPITVVYHNAKNIYVQDANGTNMLLFNYSGFGTDQYNNGDVFSFVSGHYTLFRDKINEIEKAVLGEKSTGTPIEPEEKSIADLTEEHLNGYYVIKGAHFSNFYGDGNRNFTITQGENTMAGYHKFNSVEGLNVVEGGPYNFKAIVDYYNNNLQLAPVEFFVDKPKITMPEGYNADTPVNLTEYSGAEKKYFEVKVSWPEGMTLHYKTKCRGTQLNGKTLEYSTEQLALDKEAAQKHQSALPELTYALTGDLTGTAAVSRSAGTNTVTFGFASQGTFECYVVDAAGNQSGKKPLIFQGQSTGVEDIIANGADDSEAVYYNLQGVRVANPAAGNLYIKVQGDKATKVLVK